MKQSKIQRPAIAVLAAATALFVPLPLQAAGARAADDGKSGLAAVLADDDKVLMELSARDLGPLRDYMFDKLQLTAEQRAQFKAIAAFKQLDEPGLSARQRGQLIKAIAAGVDNVLKIVKDPTQLLSLNRQLVDLGTKRALNVMEYWPANPRTQDQVRPIAEAIDKVYLRAIEVATQQEKQIESRITAQNQDMLSKQWEKLENLIGLSKFNRAFNLYTLALSMDSSDPRRAEVAKTGIEILTEYEDPQYQIQDQCRIGLGKLYMVLGQQGIGQAKQKFQQVLADKGAQWGQRFEAVYFTAVADLLDGNLNGARQGRQAVQQWLQANPPQGDAKTVADIRKGTEAAVDMLEYRILSAEADKVTGAAREQANAAAIAVLDRLAASRPDLEGIINEQIIAKLPDNPDIKSLNSRLLHALVSRGNDEILKPQGQPFDRKAVELASSAAREVVARSGKPGISADDVENSALLLAFFQLRLGHDADAANTFLDYVHQYPRSQQLSLAFENAMSLAAKLRRDQPDSRATQEIYTRFLATATAPPFNRREFNLEYAQLLLRRNVAAMEGDYDNARRELMTADALKAARLCAAVGSDPQRAIYGKFNEMMAYDQLIDLAPKSADVPGWIGRMQALAPEINQIIAARMPSASADQSRTLRLYKVKTSLLVANLAKHAQGADRKKAMENALALLANFEQDVKGLDNADAMLGEVRFLRVDFLMSLGRASEALNDLQKFIETAGDRGIDVIVSMLDTLDKEFKQALKNKDVAEATSLAANRAQVSSFLVDRVSKSKNAELRKYLPQYKSFMASAMLNAAELEKDPARRKKFLDSALGFYEPMAGVELPPDASPRQTEAKVTAQLNVAYIYYELGEYARCQPLLGELLNSKQLGTPRKIENTGTSEVMRWNDAYWGATLKLMWSNVHLVEQKASGFDQQTLEETRRYLKRLYIQWGEPGGPRWSPEFDKLRDALLPGWVPPPLEDAPATQPGAR